MFVGCGNKNHNDSSPPSISGLTLSPDSTYIHTGSITITGWYIFSDSNRDISTVTIHWTDALGHYGIITNPAGIYGYSDGYTCFYIDEISTEIATTYSIDFYVTDSTGLDSNHVYATWTVY